MKIIRQVLGLIMLLWLGHTVMAQTGGAPTGLSLKTGDPISGTVNRLEKSSVIFDAALGEVVIPFDDLSSESKVAVLKWALPLIFGKKDFCDYRLKLISTDKWGMVYFNSVIENKSPMDLPEGLELDYNIYLLTFRGLNVDTNKSYFLEDGDYYTFKQTATKITSYKTNFQKLLTGETYSFASPTLAFRETTLVNWEKLAPGAESRFRAQTYPSHSSNIPGESGLPQTRTTSSVVVSASVVELRFNFEGETVYTYLSEPLAYPHVRDLWQDPVEVYDPTAKTTAAQEPMAQKEAEQDEPETKAEPEVLAEKEEANKPKSSPPKISYNSIAIIEVDKGVGTGFLLEIKGKHFLVTNSHVIAGASKISGKTVNGKTIPLPTSFFVAKDRDLALLPIDFDGEYLQLADSFEDQIKIGDDVTVIGNEAGASVVTQLTGGIDGIGPSRVEINAKFVEGNSGSPVIHHETNRVIGLATYYIEYTVPKADRGGDETSGGSYASYLSRKNESSVTRRRFAERIDNAESWEGVTLRQLQEENKALEEYQDFMEGIVQITQGISSEKRIIDPSEAPKGVQYIIEDFHDVFRSSSGGTSGNQRALDSLKSRLVSRLDVIRENTRRNVKTYYFKEEFARAEAYDKQLQDYLKGVYISN